MAAPTLETLVKQTLGELLLHNLQLTMERDAAKDAAATAEAQRAALETALIALQGQAAGTAG